MIVAFTGRKGSGKDTAAKLFEENGYTHIKMADFLKEMLITLMYLQGATDDEIFAAIEGEDKEKPSKYLGGRTPRHAMQTLGTEWGRNLIGEDFWVSCFKNSVAPHRYVVVSDVRFPNEVAAIKELGGQVYRIVRPSVQNSNDNHPSEQMIDQLEVDGELINDTASVAEFQAQVAAMLGPNGAEDAA